MNNITCLQDILNHVPRIRIIKDWDEFYGDEFDIASNNYREKIVLIQKWEDKRFSIYDYSDVQFLTPVQYEWRYIGMGDKVSWHEVFDYIWRGWEWILYTELGDYHTTSPMHPSNMISFEPLYKLTPKEIIFSNNWNEWSAYNKACTWLRNHWYSYWSMQSDANIWFIKWDVLISKWRWLSKEDIDSLDWYITHIGGHRNGSAKIIFTK